MVSGFFPITFARESLLVSDTETTSDEERELLDRILETARGMFLDIGVRSVTMDDLAGELGMSKKTVYRLIENKADLVRNCVQAEIGSARERVQKITASSSDAIEEMLLVGTMVIESLRRFNTNTIFELKKFYPESWLLVERHHSEFVLNMIRNNLLKGINEGLYRPEINVDIVSRIYIGKMEMLMEIRPEEAGGSSTSEIYMEFFNYHIRGVASPKGVGRLAIYKNKIKLSV